MITSSIIICICIASYGPKEGTSKKRNVLQYDIFETSKGFSLPTISSVRQSIKLQVTNKFLVYSLQRQTRLTTLSWKCQLGQWCVCMLHMGTMSVKMVA